jgi:glucokinase
MTAMKKNIISWDLGATKCSAAWVEYDADKNDFVCTKDTTIKIKSCDSLENLCAHIEKDLGLKMAEADAICIGAAGQYKEGHLHLAGGYPYAMGFGPLSKAQQWPNTAVIHDYSPIVCATFTPYMNDLNNVKRLNTCPTNPLGRRIALGVGTGLGLKDGILFHNGDFWLGTNEIGHIGIPTPPLVDSYYEQRHQELTTFLRSEGIIRADEPLTFEKLLSGQGLVRIYTFFHPETKKMHPEEVGMRIQNRLQRGEESDTLRTFAWYLGLLIGTVQLAFMPEGGIWITGGVVLNHLKVFDCEDFFFGIESSPAYLRQREEFPLGVLCNAQHAFMGGAYYAAKRLF